MNILFLRGSDCQKSDKDISPGSQRSLWKWGDLRRDMLRKEVWFGSWTNSGHSSNKLHLHTLAHFHFVIVVLGCWCWGLFHLSPNKNMDLYSSWKKLTLCSKKSWIWQVWDALLTRILHICQKCEYVSNVKAGGIWWRFDGDLRDQMSVGWASLANIESTL